MIDQLLYAMLETTRIPVAVTSLQDPYCIPYQLPLPASEPSPEEARMVADVQTWTGWSNRSLAEVIGTTHPTIKALRDGHVVVIPRNREYRQRLKGAHTIAARVFLLAGRDARRTNSLLSDASGGESPMQHLIRGDVTGAYRTVLDLLQSREPTELIQSWRTLSPRDRTSAPFDEE
jgi:hypothetical protein